MRYYVFVKSHFKHTREADTCTSEVHPMFNPVAPYADMYLFMADITNPDFLV